MMGTCERLRISRVSSIPSIPGMARSVITSSGSVFRNCSSASTPSWATVTSCPLLCSEVRNTRVICGSSSTIKIRIVSLPHSLTLLRHDVHIDMRSVAHELLQREVVHILLPTFNCRPPKDSLRNPVLGNIFRGRRRDTLALQPHHGGAHVFREQNVAFERPAELLRQIRFSLDMQHVELAIHRLGQACSASGQVA